MTPALPPPIHAGKVRTLYPAGPDQLLMVASDRISAHDVVLPTEIPGKGQVLTALTVWWLDRLADLTPNHLITADVDEYPAPFIGRPELRGRSMLVRRLAMLPVECVGRAFVAGSAVGQHPGLVEGDRLPEPLFTPTTKGVHDEPLTYPQLEALVGTARAAELRRLTLAVLARAQQVCEPAGILVADTKLEFGLTADGTLTLADEVLTPDSSRFWPADTWQPGGAQPSLDKQPLRDWLAASGWAGRTPGPELPDDLVEATRARYIEAFERITGQRRVDPVS